MLIRYRPRFFVFENVLGLVTAERGAYLKNMLRYFKQIGYEVAWSRLNASHFGVLQNRRRVLLMGWQKGINFRFPEFEGETHGYTVQSIFEDLPELEAGDGLIKNGSYAGGNNDYLNDYNIRNGIDILTQHVSRPHTTRDKQIYTIAVTKWNYNKERLVYTDLPDRLITHKNKKGFFDRFKVVAANESASHTVVAHIAKDGHHYIHPDIEQNRSISVREAARLTEIIDSYSNLYNRKGLLPLLPEEIKINN